MKSIISTTKILIFLISPVFPSLCLAQIPQITHIRMSDENFVNIASGTTQFDIPDNSIGELSRPMNHITSSDGSQLYRGQLRDNYFIRYGFSCGGLKCVIIGSSMDTFRKSGSTISVNGTNVLYTTRDGDRYFINNANSMGRGEKIIRANGIVENLYYQNSVVGGVTHFRLMSVVRSDGLMIKYKYVSNDPAQAATSGQVWKNVSSVKMINLAEEYCDPIASSCATSISWPEATFAWTANSGLTLKSKDGRVHRFTTNKWLEIIGYKPPEYETEDKYKYEHCTREQPYTCTITVCEFGIGSCTTDILTGKVSASWQDGRLWQYKYTSGIGGRYWEARSTNPDGQWHTVFGNSTLFPPEINYYKETFVAGEPGYTYFETGGVGGNRPIQQKTRARPGEHNYTYDDRGNILEDKIPTDIAGQTVSETAGYAATCSNAVTCNKPLWSKDRKGNQTDYEYDPTHGGILRETSPAVNGVRPEKRYSYVQRYARYRNASGGLDQSEQPIWLLASERYCRTGAAAGNGCALANDEVVTSYEYGPDVGANNLWLRGVAVTAGGQTLRTCYGYDRYGNRISETTPSANLGVCP